MRILVLVDRYLPDLSGTAIRTAHLIERLARTNRCTFDVATLNVYMKPEGYESKKLLPSETINGVHVYRFETITHLAIALRGLYKSHHFDVIHARGSRLAWWALLTLAGYRVPVILELNYLFPQKSWLRNFLWRRTLLGVRRIITLSSAGRNWLCNEIGINPNVIDVIINGIDFERFTLWEGGPSIRKNLGLEEAVVVGYIGSFWEWQGVLQLVKSSALVLSAFPKVRYLMVGDGPDFEKTKVLVGQMGLNDSFIFTGAVPPEEIPAYLSAIDIFVLARPRMLLNELAVPLKLLEAMAMQLAVVGTDVSALKEVITDGVTGLIVEANHIAVASAIIRLVKDKTYRQKLGRSAREMVGNRFSWDQAANQLLHTYERAYQR